MTEQKPDREREPDERPRPDDELLEEQQHKGYGDDEGEREQSLPDD